MARAVRSAAVYARISSDQDGTALGVARQLEDCRKLAASLGWVVGEEYVDNDLSAYSGKPRPEYQRMLADLADGARDAVLVYHVDRLTRRPIELEQFLDVLTAAKVAQVRFVAGGDLDIGNGDGLMVLRMLLAVAANESATKSRRVKRKLGQNAAAGLPHGGFRRPFGYADDKITVVPAEAAVIRTLAERLVAGESLRSLASWLDEQGITTVGGGPWRTPTLRALLSSARIAGLREHQGQVVGSAVWEPIIPEQLRAKVLARLGEQTRTGRRSPRRYLLSGMLRCGKCQGVLFSAARQSTRRYVCLSGPDHGGCGRLTVVAAPVEDLIARAVLLRLDSPQLADALSCRAAADEHTAALALALAEDRQQQEELGGLWAAKKIDTAGWLRARADLEARIREAVTRLARLTRSDALSGLVGNGQQLRASWAELTLTRQAAIVRAGGYSSPAPWAGPQLIAGPPAPPTNVQAAAGDTSAQVSWTPPSDTGGMPIDFYYIYAYNAADNSIAKGDTASGTSTTMTGLDNGTSYYFTVYSHTQHDSYGYSGPSANSNTVTPYVNLPGAPAISSTTHSQSSWISLRDAAFTWTTAAGTYPISGYSVVFDQTSGTIPPRTQTTTVPSHTQPGIGNGTWYLHVAAVDTRGNWGAPGHYRVRVDGTQPAAPTVTSSTHPDQSQAYTSNAPQLSWTAADTSGITGYSYVLDEVAGTTPDTTSEGTVATKEYSDLESNVDYYFHVRARNGAGLWGATSTFKIHIYELADAARRDNSSTPPTTGQRPGSPVDPEPLPALGPVTDKLSTLYPQVDKLGQALDPGPLLGKAPIFNGTLVPQGNPAAQLQQTAADLVPGNVPALNTGPSVAGAFGALRAVDGLAPVLRLAQVAVYTVETTTYAQDGTPTTRTDVFPVCTPTLYSSRDGQAALPTAYDLRINFCPDARSLTQPEQRLTYTLDSLVERLPATVKIAYVLGAQQLTLTADGRDDGLPHDAGSGAARNADQFCANPSDVTLPGTLPTTAAPLDTLDGLCLELKVQPNGRAQTARLTTATSRQLRELVLGQEAVTADGGVSPTQRLVIAGLPASPSHAYTITGRTATEDEREQGLRLQLVDAQARQVGAQETFIAERLASDGRLQTRLVLSDLAQQLDTDLSARLAATGDPATAAVEGLRLLSSQAARATQQLRVENYAGDTLAALFTADSFAAAHDFALGVLKDDQDREIGVSSTAAFAQGPPTGARVQLARYHADGAPDAVLDLQRFAASSTAALTALGDPAAPAGVRIQKSDSSPVPAQLVQLLQYPQGQAPRRVVLAADAAADGRASARVAGQNLHWHVTPRVVDLSATTTRTAVSSTPSQVDVQGTAVDPDPGNQLDIDEQQGTTVNGLRLRGLTRDHSLRIQIDGELNDLRAVRFSRRNNEPRPAQGLQIYQSNQDGVLANVRFLGAGNDSTGLPATAGRRVDGLADGLPDDWTFGLDIGKDGSGRPNAAAVGGTGSTYATGASVRLEDRSQGLNLRLGALPEQYTYTLQAGLDGEGRPASLELGGTQNRDNPGGVLDVAYSGSRIRSTSLPKGFRQKLHVEGDPSNPDGATLEQAQTPASASGNPAQVLQVLADAAPRFAVTVAGPDGQPTLPTTGTRGSVTWTAAPADFTLRLARDLGDNSGSAVVSGTQPASTSASDLRVSLNCAASDSSCPVGTSQSLRKRGFSPRWSIGASYRGPLAKPDAVAVRVADSARQTADLVELGTKAGSTQTQRFAFAGPSGNAGTTPAGNVADGIWIGAPATAQFTFTRSTEPDGQLLATVAGQASSASASAEVRLRQVEQGAVRNLTIHGLATRFTLAARASGGSDPDQVAIRATASERNASDWLRLTNGTSTATRQRLLFQRSAGAGPATPTGTDADAVYTGIPEDVELRYKRFTLDGWDTAFDASLVNRTASGSPVAVPGGSLRVKLFGSGSTLPTEDVILSKIPATVSRLRYDLPSSGNSNCLGDIGYAATDSNADVDLMVNRAGACFAGTVRAKISGMPSKGFARAEVRNDGGTDFATFADDNGSPQQVGRLKVDAPVPNGLTARFNNPKSLPLTQFCPEVGRIGVGPVSRKVLCINAAIEARNLVFDGLRLQIEADRLSNLRVRSNVGQPDYNQNAGASSERDKALRAALWDSLPLLAIQNGGAGEVKVKLTGQDRPGDGSAIVQRVDCCTQPFKNVEFRTTSVIPDGQPLGVEFWSWNVCRDGNGTEVKCNRAGEALNYTKGSFVRTRLPTNEPHALPFGPSFDASYYNHSNLNDPENNTLFVRPGDTTYFVPNPYAAFMAQGPGRQDMWSVSAQGGVYDTDWFWPMLLHVNASDPLGMT